MSESDKKEKISYWKNILKELETNSLPAAKKRMNGVRVGDWYQNAEFEDGERQIELIQARIKEIRLLIKSLK